MSATAGIPKPYTTTETADIMRVERRSVIRWATTGLFPPGVAFQTPGGHWRYDRDGVNAMSRGELTAGAA